MAEFCKDCFKKEVGNEEVIVSSWKELCEGCGEIKQIVVTVKNQKWVHCEEAEIIFKQWPKWKQDLYKTF